MSASFKTYVLVSLTGHLYNNEIYEWLMALALAYFCIIYQSSTLPASW